MTSEWRSVTLDTVYEFRSGLSKPRKDFGAGHPFLTFKDVFYNIFTPQDLGDLVQSTRKEREAGSVLRGDVFLTRTSETMEDLGMSSVALRDYEEATFNGFTKRLRPKMANKIVPEYAGYYFRSPRFRQEVTAMSSLSTRASLNNSMLSALSIVLPPVGIQESIGFTLKALDDKIDLNRRMNETLEAMARALFKSWFVDFDPVRAKMEGRQPFGMDQATADLFPDRLVESEIGLIPEGWEVTTLGDAIDIFDNLRVPLNKRERGERQGEYPYYGAASIMDYVDDYLFDGVHVLAGEDGSVVDENGRPVVQYVWGKFWVNNHAHVLKGKNSVSDEHLLLYLMSLDIAPYVTGAVQPKLNQTNLKSVPFLMPTETACNHFSRVITKWFESIRITTEQSRTLAELRDLLLPKLLSGEIRVADAEQEVEAAL